MWFRRVQRQLRSLWARDQEPPTVIGEESVSSLRLDLAEREREISALQGRLERADRERSQLVSSEVRARQEKLVATAAAPVAQILTQAYVAEQGKALDARDVLVIARRLISALEDAGLVIDTKIGERVRFDPNRHMPMAVDAAPRTGDQVVVRSVGISLDGKVLTKAGVQRVAER